MNWETGIPDSIQDWLSTQNSGHWFCWGHPTNRRYEDLKIIDNRFPKPTEEECINGLAAMVLEHKQTQYQKDRRTAYKLESDRLYFEEVRGEVPEGTWAAKVNEIKIRYPKWQMPPE